MFEFIQSFDVDGPNISDHCCISLNLQFPLYDATLADEISFALENANGKCLWNSDLLNDYKDKLNSDSVQNQFQDLNINRVRTVPIKMA